MEAIKDRVEFKIENLTDLQAGRRLSAAQGVVGSSGLVVDSRHRFRLTPDRLVLNHVAREQFGQVGDLILAGFAATKRIFLKAKEKKFPDDINRFLVSALEAGMTRGHKKTLVGDSNQLPLFFRADCVLAKAGDDVSVKITEIEGERSIAFGFASLLDRVNLAVNSISDRPLSGGLGVGNGISLAIRESQFSGDKIGLISGEDQLFYRPEQQVFVDELNRLGAPVELVGESQVVVRPGEPVSIVLPSGEETNVAISLPLFNHQKSGKGVEGEQLRLAFLDKKFRFLLPPEKFFGTKSVMALMKQPVISDLFLQEGVPGELMDTLIPPTRIIAGQISEVERLLLEMGCQTDPPTLIKAVGMTAGRGMAMPDDKEGIGGILKAAKGSPFEFITQQFLETATPGFRIFDKDKEQIHLEPQFMRLAAFFANINGKSALLGVTGTGLPNSFVHGNPNCIFFPVVFEEEK